MDDTIQDPELNDQAAEPQEERRRGWVGWLISGVFHAALIAVMATVYWLVAEPQKETPPVYSQVVDPPEKKEKPKRPDIDEKPKIEIDAKIAEDPAPKTDLVLPPEEIVQAEDPLNPPSPEGNPDLQATEMMATLSGPAAIGPGATAPGALGNRTPGGKHRAVVVGGGTPGSEAAVDRALRWFKRHQSPNGMWDAARYPVNCTEDPKCEPGSDALPGKVNVAMTGYAVMCFLGAGYDSVTPSKYQKTVKKGIQYLVSVQTADGVLGERNYEHAIAAKSLIEDYMMTGDPSLKEPAQKAVDVIVARENPDATAADKAYGGLGWDYLNPGDRNDSSVTGWNVMALKSALGAGLNVGHGIEGAKNWLNKTWKATNPQWKTLDPYKDESRFPYTYAGAAGTVDIAAAPGPGQPAADSKDLACVGLMSAVFLGAHQGDAMLETLGNYVCAHECPTAYPCNTYKLYYDTLGVFQLGGERWKKWNGVVRDALVHGQRIGDGCLDGSWDWKDTRFHGHDAGRVLSTAYCCMSLEVYYIYDHVMGKAAH
jgi:hypothetical protein